jgi:putative selenate reductase
MNDFCPLSFSALLNRLRSDILRGGALFGLERKHWYHPVPSLDLCVKHGDNIAGTPLGPAAGPHTQLAQNMLLGWLGGARIFELKTLQVLDNLSIPRPCIHAPNLAFNVEWSQELRLEQSLLEYAKTAWLLKILVDHHESIGLPPGDWLQWSLDLSLGYDLPGLQSEAMHQALDQMKNPAELFQTIAKDLSEDLLEFAGQPPKGPIADTITLSTFHGCPPNEIDGMVRFLMEKEGWNVVIKFNPTLLGEDELKRQLHEKMGYKDLRFDSETILGDLAFSRAIPMIKDLQACAQACGKTLGAKFTNTLVLQSDSTLFPEQTDPHMYLSGAPLHPLAIATASLISQEVQEPLPLSFSAGIDRKNVGATVACGFSPVTVCTDLLRQGGYARMAPLLRSLEKEMLEAGCKDLIEFAGHQGSPSAEAWRGMQSALKARVNDLDASFAYNSDTVRKSKKAPTTTLQPYDCLTCDLCISACPNGAFFAWNTDPDDPTFHKKHQLAFLADACNACGNCNTYCPEIGNPIHLKECVFLSEQLWESEKSDGILIVATRLCVRFEGNEFELANSSKDIDAIRERIGSNNLNLDSPLLAHIPGTLRKRTIDLLRYLIFDSMNSTSAYWNQRHD